MKISLTGRGYFNIQPHNVIIEKAQKIGGRAHIDCDLKIPGTSDKR